MSDSDLVASLTGAGHVNTFLDRPRVCRRCGTAYTERENIGQWRCTNYHPLSRFATVHDTLLACCNRHYTSPGCVAADHTDSLMLDNEPKLITTQVAALLDVKKMFRTNAWIKNANQSYLVHRVDPVAYERSISVTHGSEEPHFDALRAPRVDKRIY